MVGTSPTAGTGGGAAAALSLVARWPVAHVSAAVLARGRDGSVVTTTAGDPHHRYRLASIAKPITAWAALVAVEEGTIALDTPVGQPGSTLEHLLAHAGGYAFDGREPIAAPGVRRIYSNTGIELAAEAIAGSTGMPFGTYLHDAVLAPLGMASTELLGSPAHAVWSTVEDLCRFAAEVLDPTLISAATAARATSVAFGGLAGIVPGIGRFDPCPWGLGFEIRGDKSPHWSGRRNSPATFGHFGGAGTLFWVDRGLGDPSLACIALTDRSFDEWPAEALRSWSELSDAVVHAHAPGAVG